jgi:hypothetical protein|tara:strand:- start:486 stop:599 length:114 start_codon:yes stop_codon:yes gene_type:complete
MFDSISSDAEVDPIGKMFLEERGMGGASKPFQMGVPK